MEGLKFLQVKNDDTEFLTEKLKTSKKGPRGYFEPYTGGADLGRSRLV